MIIAVSFLILGVLLWLMPPFPLAILVGNGIGLVLFLIVRHWKPIAAMIVFTIVFTVGALYTFFAGDFAAIPLLGVVGVIAALVHHNAMIFLDVSERATQIDLNRDGVIGVSHDELAERKDTALRYVFGFTNRNDDTFKRRIARENITHLNYLSQREWREWVRELEWAGVIQCVNAQVTRPMVSTYTVARQLLDAVPDVVLEPHPDQPGRMVRQ